MAKSLSRSEAAELGRFVNELFRLGGFRTWVDFANEAGYPAPNLSDVQLGKASIDGANLVSLIRAAARRADQEAAFVAAAAAQAASPSLERRLEEVGEMVALGFEALGVEPEQLRPAGDEPPRTKQA